MYQRIKKLADEAVALQNKARMEAALREISALCDNGAPMDAEQFEAAELAQHRARNMAQSMQAAGESVVSGIELLAAVETGKATLLTKKQRGAKK